MNKITKLFLISILIIYSCGVPKHIKNDFSIKYIGTNTGIDSNFQTHGFYTTAIIFGEKDSMRISHIFFPDGIFITGFGGYTPDYILKKIEKEALDSIGSVKRSIYNSYYKGIYTIIEDTIITQSINRPAPPKVWLAYEEHFIIVDKNTIQQISSKQMGKYSQYEIEMEEQEEKKKKYLPAYFISAPVIPKLDIWLKNKKWFWADKLEYKEYMKNLKEEKKKKKEKATH